jgi:hypothetical protein
VQSPCFFEHMNIFLPVRRAGGPVSAAQRCGLFRCRWLTLAAGMFMCGVAKDDGEVSSGPPGIGCEYANEGLFQPW